jgi:hypothetical protein
MKNKKVLRFAPFWPVLVRLPPFWPQAKDGFVVFGIGCWRFPFGWDKK